MGQSPYGFYYDIEYYEQGDGAQYKHTELVFCPSAQDALTIFKTNNPRTIIVSIEYSRAMNYR